MSTTTLALLSLTTTPAPQPLFAFGTLLVVFLVVAVGLIAGGIWLRFSQVRKRLSQRFEDFKDRVMSLRQQVEQIKERHQGLPAQNNDLQGMTGRTLAVYQQVDTDVKRLWDGWLQRMDAWDRVQKSLETASLFRVGQLLEAEKQLDQLAFEEVDRGCKTCVEHLDRLEQGHQQARELVQQVRELFEPRRQQIAAVGRLGLATAPYEPELAQCQEQQEQAGKMIQADPIGATETLEETRSRLQKLERWLAEVTEQFERQPAVLAELEQVQRTVASKRAGGLLLHEPEGNPDPLLVRGHAAHQAAEPALQHGEAQQAREHLDEALQLATQAQTLIERQEAARSFCGSAIPARTAESQRLQQMLGQAQGWHTELLQEFAPESWNEVVDHLNQASTVHETALSRLGQAERSAQDDFQYYFQASSLLEEAERLQHQEATLLQSFERRLRDLQDLRRSCSQRAADLGSLAREAANYFTLHSGSIQSATAGRLSAASASLHEVERAMGRPRVNWPEVRNRLEESWAAYTAARQQAEKDVQLHQQLHQRLATVGRESERIGTFLRERGEIRTEASRAYSRALENLEELRRNATRDIGDWGQLLRQVEETAASLTRAEQLGQDDLKLAEQAHAAIEAASRDLWQGQSLYQAGGSVAVPQAEQLLEQARRELANQDYEAVAATTQRAQQAVRQARAEAERQAQAEQERQRLQAAAQMAPLPVDPNWPPKRPDDDGPIGGGDPPQSRDDGPIGGEVPVRSSDDGPIGGDYDRSPAHYKSEKE